LMILCCQSSVYFYLVLIVKDSLLHLVL
jgi:hypothetical protein